MIKKIIFSAQIILITFTLSAQLEVQSYVDKTKIGLQDYLKLTIEISGEDADRVSQPSLTKLENFDKLGSSSSSSSSIQIINGKMESSITKSYTYTLRPRKTGKFMIPPITIKYKKKSFVTKPITINVIEGSTEPAPPTSNRLKNNNQQSSDKLADNLFIIAEVNKSSVYENEPIIVDYKIYTRYEVSDLEFASDPTFNGFWKEDVYTPSRINFKRETRNGMLFNMMLLRSVALFPNQTGNLHIPALEMNVDIRTQSRSFFDFGTTKRYIIKSQPKTINVKELPQAGRPSGFSGAVGNFKLSSNISEKEMKVGDSFTYTLEITGTGNLNQFDAPVLPDIPNLRFMEPEITTDIQNNKISGKKTIKYLVIAQEKGIFTIPAVFFSYFDIEQKKYITKQTKAFTIDVKEGDAVFIPSSSAQSTVQMEGYDIGFIIKDASLKNNVIFLDSFYYWLLWFLVLLSIPVSLFYAREKEKLAVNIDYVRQKKAKKILKKYMKQASIFAENNQLDFYTSAQTGLVNYLSDKLKISRGSTIETIIEKIGEKNFPENLIFKIKQLFEKCNQARFMPGGFSKENIKNDFTELQDIVGEISKIKM
ncbi:MAG TPA: protein BatD [Candidatus Cloacimonetes bacterium]|nr:protein BatD [Candidatus Cloacimonadota bacterium]